MSFRFFLFCQSFFSLCFGKIVRNVYHEGFCGNGIAVRVEPTTSLQQCDANCRQSGTRTDRQYIAAAFDFYHHKKGDCLCYTTCDCWDMNKHYETVFFGSNKPAETCAVGTHLKEHYLYHACMFAGVYVDDLPGNTEDKTWVSYGCDPFNNEVYQNLYTDFISCHDQLEPVRTWTHDMNVCLEDYPGEFVKVTACHETGMDITICERDVDVIPDIIPLTKSPTPTPVPRPFCALSKCGCPGSGTWDDIPWASKRNCAPSGFYCQSDKYACETECAPAEWCPYDENVDHREMCTDCLATFDKAAYCDIAFDLDNGTAHHLLPSGCNWCLWEIIAHCEGGLNVKLHKEERRIKREEATWTWLIILMILALVVFVCVVRASFHQNLKKAEQEDILLNEQDSTVDILLENQDNRAWNTSPIQWNIQPTYGTPTRIPEDTPSATALDSEIPYQVGDVVEVRHDVYDAPDTWKLGQVMSLEPDIRVRQLNKHGKSQHILSYTSMRRPAVGKALHRLRRGSTRELISTGSVIAFADSTPQHSTRSGRSSPSGPSSPSGRSPVIGPIGRTHVLGPTGRTSVVGPTGRTSVIGPNGRTSVIGPNGRTSLIGPTGRTSVIGPAGRSSGSGSAGKSRKSGGLTIPRNGSGRKLSQSRRVASGRFAPSSKHQAPSRKSQSARVIYVQGSNPETRDERKLSAYE